MANELTGDYEVVAAFTLGAVDRILAGMHRGKRLPHSMSVAIDDVPELRLGAAVVSVVDRFGEAETDIVAVRKTAYSRSASTLSAEIIARVDPVVNWRPDPPAKPLPPSLQVRDTLVDTVSPIWGIVGENSSLSGVAQLQLGPPTMKLSQRTDFADIHTPVTIRYLADPHTRLLAELMQGEIVTSFGVKHVNAPSGTTIVVDTVGPSGNVSFQDFWTSIGLDASDRTSINRALKKALKHSFQPSSTPMPSTMKKVDFKGFPGQNAVGMLMNVTNNSPASPNSVGGVFLRGNDQFAMAVNGDSITGPLAAAVNASVPRRIQLPDQPFKFGIDLLFTSIDIVNCIVHSRVDLGAASVSIIPDVNLGFFTIPGQIILSIPARVFLWWEGKPSTVSIPSQFDMNIVQAFHLSVYGREVAIEPNGPVAVNYSGDTLVRTPIGAVRDLKDYATPAATSLFNNAWNAQAATINARLNQSLSANNLQAFLQKLMNPISKPSPFSQTFSLDGTPTDPDTLTETVKPDLQYTSVELRVSGIVLHGSLSVPAWPQPSVHFDKDPWSTKAVPQYQALKSWIPGGTINKHSWHFYKQDLNYSHQFVTLNAPALALDHVTVCLTITGQRITAAGSVTYESVSSRRLCRLMGIPVGLSVTEISRVNKPHVIVPKPVDPGGRVESIAHASPWITDGTPGANLVVYFPDGQSVRDLDVVTSALAHSGRVDTETAVIAVLTPDLLTDARYVPGVLYSDDSSAWEGLIGLRERPGIAIVGPKGDILWRKESAIGASELAEVFRRYLVTGATYSPAFVSLPLRTGELSPNFLYEMAPGQLQTLRKSAGQRIALVFFRNSSAPSVATVRLIEQAYCQDGVDRGLVIAVCDGESGEFTRGFAAGEGDVVVVPDPQRQISRAYGISVWPTVVFLDRNGLVEDIHVGLLPEKSLGATLEDSPQAEDKPFNPHDCSQESKKEY